jgi:putative ABC transport system ATP-binding protein
LPTLTIERNVAMPLLLDGRRFAPIREQVRSLLDRVGLRCRAGAYPDELSGGEMQRVAIARALVNKPALLLADEPTGNLDSATSEQVMAVLAESARGNGRTLVVVTHDERIASRADRLVRLRDGRIDAAESPPAPAASAR